MCMCISADITLVVECTINRSKKKKFNYHFDEPKGKVGKGGILKGISLIGRKKRSQKN